MLGCENAVKFYRTSAVEYLLGGFARMTDTREKERRRFRMPFVRFFITTGIRLVSAMRCRQTSMTVTLRRFIGFWLAVVRSRSLSSIFFGRSVTLSVVLASRRSYCDQ